jgi:lysophospholipase L1-like esterase
MAGTNAKRIAGRRRVRRPLVFVIGDSISGHYGEHLEKMIAPRFAYARKTGQERELEGGRFTADPNGGDSSAVRAYLEAMCAGGRFHPDILLINCGLHDIKTNPKTGAIQVPAALYRRNLQAIVRLARKAAWQVIWMRTTPVDDRQHNERDIGFHRFARDVTRYNAAADRIMTAAGIPMIDLHGFTASLKGNPYCDHVHFTEPVRQLQAAFIAGFLYAMQNGGHTC